MNAARVIHGIAAFMLLGLAFVMLREFGISYKFGHLSEIYRTYDTALRESNLPWLSALILPLRPIAWWSALTPLFCAIGVAARVPANSSAWQAIHWLTIVIVVNLVVLGVLFAYMKATSLMGYPSILPPTPLEIGTNVTMLVAAGIWMTRGILVARRG
jgi:hypothetical protein